MAFRFTSTLNTATDLMENQDEPAVQSADTSNSPTTQQSEPAIPKPVEEPATMGKRKSASSAPSKAPTGSRSGKRAAGARNSESTKRCQIGFWLTLSERRALRTVCVNNDTNITSFASSAVLDAMRYTYECTSAGCHCQFTLRANDDSAPAKAVRCPVCGEKVSAVRY